MKRMSAYRSWPDLDWLMVRRLSSLKRRRVSRQLSIHPMPSWAIGSFNWLGCVRHRIPPLTSHSLILNRPATTTAPTPIIQENYGERIKELTTTVHKKNELLQQQLNMYRMIFAKIDNMGEMTKEKMELMDFLKQRISRSCSRSSTRPHRNLLPFKRLNTSNSDRSNKYHSQSPQQLPLQQGTIKQLQSNRHLPRGTNSEGGQQEGNSADMECEFKTPRINGKTNVPTVSFSGRSRGRGGTILRGGPLVRDRGVPSVAIMNVSSLKSKSLTNEPFVTLFPTLLYGQHCGREDLRCGQRQLL